MAQVELYSCCDRDRAIKLWDLAVDSELARLAERLGDDTVVARACERMLDSWEQMFKGGD